MFALKALKLYERKPIPLIWLTSTNLNVRGDFALRKKPSLACPEGLEPPTYCLEGNCSIQLSYGQPDPRVYRALQRDSSKALLTTLTELNAIAAPATMGLSPPRAAKGIPRTL